ncbi:MAG: holo-ACP synthase [Acidimicrobiaceae bacterium]|jgi:holo-[acyl-carrier protein] synthase
MATVGIGIDIVDVPRFEKVLARRPKIVDRLFTEGEKLDTKLRPQRLAARFAAKEAVMKACGVGVGSTGWKTIEVKKMRSGAPMVVLHGTAQDLADRVGIKNMHITLTHTDMSAAAFVVGTDDAG